MRARPPLAALFLVLAAACAGTVDDSTHAADRQADSSPFARFIHFSFDSELVLEATRPPEEQIRAQLMFLFGQMKAIGSEPEMTRVVISDVRTEQVGAETVARYHVEMPVAWGNPGALPPRHEIVLPRSVANDFLAAFYERYIFPDVRREKPPRCYDGQWGHDRGFGGMWYSLVPTARGCSVRDEDLSRSFATVTPSASAARGKYPEYDEVWRDGELRVLVAFTEDSIVAAHDVLDRELDVGVKTYDDFVARMRALLTPYALETAPADLRAAPGPYQRDVELRGTLPDGRRIVVNALLVASIEHPELSIPSGFPGFRERFDSLSTRADVVAYEGHAGLGVYVDTFLAMGRYVAGQYAIMLVDGCSTYGYITPAFRARRAALDPSDPRGTKHLDLVLNAVESPFSSAVDTLMAFVEALAAYDRPRTYDQILARLNAGQVLLVSGDEDNAYVPPASASGPVLSEFGAVAERAVQRYATPPLPAGRYVVQLVGDADADLLVQRNLAPTTSFHACASYEEGSEERCEVDVAAGDVLYALVEGRYETTTFHLTVAAR